MLFRSAYHRHWPGDPKRPDQAPANQIRQIPRSFPPHSRKKILKTTGTVSLGTCSSSVCSQIPGALYSRPYAPRQAASCGTLRDIRIPRKRNACVWDSFPAIPDAPFHPILIEHFCIQNGLPCMEQNKSKPSACRLLGPLATNTSMDFGFLLLSLGFSVMMIFNGIPKLVILIR